MANDRYGSFLQMMGLLQGAYSTAGQLKNTADSIAVNKYQAEQQARQFDANADYTKEGRDYIRGLTELTAKQSAEYKVAEDEAKRLYKDWGTVKKVLNPDGYTFTYSPAKMDEWEYKKIKEQGLNSGGYGQQVKSDEPKIGQLVNGYVYMGNGQWSPQSVENTVKPYTGLTNAEALKRQSSKDYADVWNRNPVPNALPWGKSIAVQRSGYGPKGELDYSDYSDWAEQHSDAITTGLAGSAAGGGIVGGGTKGLLWLSTLFPSSKGGK